MSLSTHSKFSVAEVESDGLLRVTATGSLTSQNLASASGNVLRGLLGPQWTNCRILLDLSEVGFIDSSAIGWMIESHKSTRDGGGCLVIHSLATRVRQMLELLNLNQILNLQADATTARAYLTAHSKCTATAA